MLSAAAEAQSLAEVLTEGAGRLLENNTWKVWQWPAGGQEFFDAESFRWDKTQSYLCSDCIIQLQARSLCQEQPMQEEILALRVSRGLRQQRVGQLNATFNAIQVVDVAVCEVMQSVELNLHRFTSEAMHLTLQDWPACPCLRLVVNRTMAIVMQPKSARSSAVPVSRRHLKE